MAVKNVSEDKYRDVVLETDTVEEYIDYYMMIMNLQKAPKYRLDPKKIQIVREIILWQGRHGIIEGQLECRKFTKHLIKKKVINAATTLSAHKTKLKSAGWIVCDHTYHMKVSDKYVQGAKAKRISLSIQIKGAVEKTNE